MEDGLSINKKPGRKEVFCSTLKTSISLDDCILLGCLGSNKNLTDKVMGILKGLFQSATLNFFKILTSCLFGLKSL
jgi:hypothetical protein